MKTNGNLKEIIKNSLLASFGLFLFGFGAYLTIQANLGVAPWDAFNLGLSNTFGIKYGTASITVSLVILVFDIMLKEKIGIGMFLDAFIVGKSVDLLNYLDLIPLQNSIWSGLALIIAGLFVMGFAQFLYMKAALGCGPRDTLLVGLKRRLKKVPIGFISISMLTVATAIGWILGGPIGIGTLICAGLEGMTMQLVFRIVGFIPTDVKHQDIIESGRMIFKKKS